MASPDGFSGIDAVVLIVSLFLFLQFSDRVLLLSQQLYSLQVI